MCDSSDDGYYSDTQVTPTFTQIGPLCQNSTAPALPQHQTMALRNLEPATISTAAVGTITYTFTPQIHVRLQRRWITITTQVTPTFTQIGPLCQNSTAPTLPATSDNGFAGTWNPQRSVQQQLERLTYTFTPTDPCATSNRWIFTMTAQVTPTLHR
jgi:hypothetical protein